MQSIHSRGQSARMVQQGGLAQEDSRHGGRLVRNDLLMEQPFLEAHTD